MAEYWKSTPRYWCKFCKVYVRDTKFERQQHEATARHNGNVQRSLRELHKTQEREERETQRAKDEVARVNGVVAKAATSSSNDPSGKRHVPLSVPTARQQATPDERKRQLAQLAEMGIAIPDEYRRDMAMAGDWQIVSETPIGSAAKQERDATSETGATGIRKRKAEGDQDEEGVGGPGRRRAWGSTFKSYPGSKGTDEDIEAILNSAGTLSTRIPSEKTDGSETKEEQREAKLESVVKKEDPDAKEAIEAVSDIKETFEHTFKRETNDATRADDDPGTSVVFKKRKNKRMRPA